MVIMREKRRCIASRNLLVRAVLYDNMRTRTVLPLHQINTINREMKRQIMVQINNNPVEDNGCRLKLDPLLCYIYDFSKGGSVLYCG